jgi:protein-tyrosine phosphatase
MPALVCLKRRNANQNAVRAVMEVEAAYLDTAFGAIETGAGSLDAYFETVLGVTPSVREAIMARLLIDNG